MMNGMERSYVLDRLSVLAVQWFLKPLDHSIPGWHRMNSSSKPANVLRLTGVTRAFSYPRRCAAYRPGALGLQSLLVCVCLLVFPGER